MIVQKYGGSCLADTNAMRLVVEKIIQSRQQNEQVVVVVSAISGETDRLLALASHFTPTPCSRETDALLASGEQISAALVAIGLSARGCASVSLSAAQVPIRTDSRHGNAMINYLPPQKIRHHLSEGRVVIVTGYQGVTDLGDVTTLGRGGSDLTAVALAAALEAKVCEIYKDVPGVFTADPQVCGDARPIQRISYDEMLELANLGAKVLQARSVQLAKRYYVPIHVRSFVGNGVGTWVIAEDKTMEGTVVSAVTCDRKESKISIRNLPVPLKSVTDLFSALDDEGIIVDVIVQDRAPNHAANVTFTVPRSDFERALQIVHQIVKSVGTAEIVTDEKIAKISAVGLGMRSHSGVAAQMFKTLAKEKIEIMAVSTSDIKISCVVDDRYAELAVRTLHDSFGLAKEPN